MRRTRIDDVRGRILRRGGAALCIILPLLLLASIALSGDGYELSWWAVSGGGGASSGGAYEVSSTAGQPSAGEASGGDYDLVGGYVPEDKPPETVFRIYLPLVPRGQ